MARAGRIAGQVVRKAGVPLVATGVVVAAMVWLSGTLRTGRISPQALTPPPPSPTTRAVTVERVVRPHYAELVGSVQAEARSAITARIMANILEVRAKAGDHVSKGDVLVVLDDRDLQARLGQAKGALRAAEAKRDLAKLEMDRLGKMVEQKVASIHEFDQWRTQHAAAVADVARARETILEAEVALSDAQLRSPYTGIVIDRQAEPGDQASPGRAILTVYDPTRLRLEASVREALVGRLSQHQPISVYIDALKQERPGKVQEIVPVSDPLSRSFLVKVQIVDPAGLYPGMFGRVRLPLSPQPQLEIPLAAVEQVGQVSLVTALVDGRPQRRAVRLGQVDAGRVEVLAGLLEGEKVVLAR